MASTKQTPSIVWFRNDLRLSDNLALKAALDRGGPVLFLYVFEDGHAGRPLGGASRWWLDKSLKALQQAIAARGGALTLRRGDAQQIVPALAQTIGAGAVFWNRRYDKAGREVDQAIKKALKDDGVSAESYNAALINEPWTVKTQGGDPYKVYSPYARAVFEELSLPEPIPSPEALPAGPEVDTDALADWGLHPSRPDWSEGLGEAWTPGEAGAKTRLHDFVANALKGYDERRNVPGERSTSGLSPHLRFGEISPWACWRAAASVGDAGEAPAGDVETFHKELLWREFSYQILFHWPDLAAENWKPAFDAMPWRDDEAGYRAWTKGRTGYPIVDAGMRELWATGWMHNRVRMIVASFLTKHLLIDWRRGEDWFWDTLVDADPASNAASWQWVAGSGADAAPYFRIFNPTSQSERYDANGAYIRKWVPELGKLSDKHLHAPWQATDRDLKRAGVVLGESYPCPVVDHLLARQRALDAYDAVKSAKSEAA